MGDNFAFKVCRGCLAPEISTRFTSLFSENIFQKFISITNVDILCDSEENEALICDKCIEKLDAAFAFAEHVQKLEEIFFANARTQKMKLKEKIGPKDEIETEPVKTNDRRSLKRKAQKSGGENSGMKLRAVELEEEIVPEVNEMEPPMTNKHQLKECTVPLMQILSPAKEEIQDAALEVEHLQIEPTIEEPTPFLLQPGEVFSKNRKQRKPSRISMIQLPPFKEENDTSRRHSDGFQSKPKGIPCEFDGCGKICRDKFAYYQHKASHSDERPFVCHCGQSYKLKQHLSVHMKNFHSKKGENVKFEA